MSTTTEVDVAAKRRDDLRRKLEYARRSEAQGIKLATLIRHIEQDIEVAQQRHEQDTRAGVEKLEDAAQSDRKLALDKLAVDMAEATERHQENVERLVRQLKAAKSLEGAVLARGVSAAVAVSALVNDCDDAELNERAAELREEIVNLESRRHETQRKLNTWKASVGSEIYLTDETYRKRVDRVVDTSQKALVRLEQRIVETGQQAEECRRARAEY